jgi:hypothetical protein
MLSACARLESIGLSGTISSGSAFESLPRSAENDSQSAALLLFRLVAGIFSYDIRCVDFVSRKPIRREHERHHTALIEVREINRLVVIPEASAEHLKGPAAGAPRSAFEKCIHAVILRMNSPAAVQFAGIIHDEIFGVHPPEKKRKRSMSRGRRVLRAFRRLHYCRRCPTITDKASVGSISVLMDGFGFTGVMEKFGVERAALRLLYAGETRQRHRRSVSPLTALRGAFPFKHPSTKFHNQFIKIRERRHGAALRKRNYLFGARR